MTTIIKQTGIKLPMLFTHLTIRNLNVPIAKLNTKFIHCQTFIDDYRYSFFPRTMPQLNHLVICNIEEVDIETANME